jgi:hypothetical protein
MALVPLLSLLLIATLARAWNGIHHERREPALPAPLARSDRATLRLKYELKEALLRYRALTADAQRAQATHAPSWQRWQRTVEGEQVAQRLAELTSWGDFTVGEPEERPSGHTGVVLSHGDRCLKAWLVPAPTGWKLVGLVEPSQP